jgi:periplasmic divalent cation tolerance protein
MNQPSRYVLVLTTVADPETARMIARALVEQRLAACVHIDEIDSVYRWDGRINEEKEWRVMAKTTYAAADRVRAAIHALHPYDLPALSSIDMRDVDPDYAAWIDESVG